MRTCFLQIAHYNMRVHFKKFFTRDRVTGKTGMIMQDVLMIGI